MAKGLDLVGWRPCAKQQEQGPKRFITNLKKLGRQAAVGRTLPPPSAASVGLTPDQRRRFLQGQELRQAAATFAQGTPECPECPLADTKPFGCFSFVDFPIDAVAETALFRYFTSKLDDEHSHAFGIWRDLVSKVPASGTPWHVNRGASGDLAELETPLVKEWGFLMWKKRVDSAQLLSAIFFSQKRLALISVFSAFWEGFIQEARAEHKDFDSSTTLVQLEALSELYTRVAEHASHTEGVQLLVDNDATPEKE